MRRIDFLQVNSRNVVFFLIALLIVLADQLSKMWIRGHFIIGQTLFPTGFFQITYVRNTGAAFGLFRGQSLTLTIVASIGVIVILLCALLFNRWWPFLNSMVSKSALGLVLGGTVGNLIDRFRLGYVTDFIDFRFWPAFNIADSAVTVGVIIFAFYFLCLAQAGKG